MFDVIEMCEPQELVLRTNASADELRERWQYLATMLDAVGQNMADASDRWKGATDTVVKQRLWVEYEVIAREFRVLCSWKDVFYAAYIFSTDGADCAALDGISS